jgi:hypothetical protein
MVQIPMGMDGHPRNAAPHGLSSEEKREQFEHVDPGSVATADRVE